MATVRSLKQHWAVQPASKRSSGRQGTRRADDVASSTRSWTRYRYSSRPTTAFVPDTSSRSAEGEATAIGTGIWLRRALKRNPEARVWSKRSVEVIEQALTETAQTIQDHVVVNLGAAIEGVFGDALRRHPGVLRIGLPHLGSVDAVGDILDLPVRDETVDLFLSSSVLEHVSDPERGVQEMARVVRPAGLVYGRSLSSEHSTWLRSTISGTRSVASRSSLPATASRVSRKECAPVRSPPGADGRDALIDISSPAPRRVRKVARSSSHGLCNHSSTSIAWPVTENLRVPRLATSTTSGADKSLERNEPVNRFMYKRTQESS